MANLICSAEQKVEGDKPVKEYEAQMVWTMPGIVALTTMDRKKQFGIQFQHSTHTNWGGSQMPDSKEIGNQFCRVDKIESLSVSLIQCVIKKGNYTKGPPYSSDT